MRGWQDGRVALVLLAMAAPVPVALSEVVLPEPAPTVSERLGGEARVPAPRVRIGLDLREDGQVFIGSTRGGFRVLHGLVGKEIWPARAEGDVLVVPEGGRAATVEEIYRVQVGSFRNEEEAKRLAATLEQEHREPADAHWQPSRGVWRVRIGREPDRSRLRQLLERLRTAGFDDAWVVGEPRERREGGTLRLLDDHWDVHSSGASRLVFLPSSRGRLTVDGTPYRGLVEVLIDPFGRLRAVNEIPLETYLRGVVPRELGPAVWPELAALKAQTIAARTYILANLGQYEEDGFDICDTPRCQVYGGAAAEHPLTDRAIRETEGEILVYEGRPINAMYTSTCGGATENVENVFPDMEAPYLRGVSARPKPEELERILIRVDGRSPPSARMEPAAPGAPSLLELTGLVAADVVPRAALDGAWRARPVEAHELAAWAGALARLAGKPAPAGPPEAVERLALLRWWRHVLGPQEPASALLGPGDAAFVLALEDRAEIPVDDRVLVASLLAEGILVPRPDGRLAPREVPSRGEVLGWLARAAERYDVSGWREGVLVEEDDRGRLVVREGRLERSWMPSPEDLDLLVSVSGSWHQVGSIDMLPGDPVQILADEGDRKLLALAVLTRRGVADDRFGSLYRWERVRERSELEASLRRVAPVGRLKSLHVLERGVSGRVSRVELVGTGGRAVVEGFRIRRALDLPEILFTVELQREPNGLLRRAIFSGRGWGHGVGLCQIGAYGMALRGKSYREILDHYYTGAALVRVVPQSP